LLLLANCSRSWCLNSDVTRYCCCHLCCCLQFNAVLEANGDLPVPTDPDIMTKVLEGYLAQVENPVAMATRALRQRLEQAETKVRHQEQIALAPV